MQLFNKYGQRTLEIEKDLFTWTAANGHETKYDGTLLIALMLSGIKPHLHVDMWAKMKKTKELTLQQHGNSPVKSLDEMKMKKLLIDKKDPNAYSDNLYVKDIFAQLMLAVVLTLTHLSMKKHTFVGCMERRLLRLTLFVAKQSFITLIFTTTKKWLRQHSATDQVVILTTTSEEQSKQMRTMATDLSKLKSSGGGSASPSDGPKSNDDKGSRWVINE